eukprot:4127052-Amphidinium_carterae.1
MVLIEDDAEDEAPYRAAAASTSDSDDPDVSPLEEPDASGSEESSGRTSRNGNWAPVLLVSASSSVSEESPDDVQNVSKIMDASTTTVLTTSDDSEEFHD